jgi:hypothetical protein
MVLYRVEDGPQDKYNLVYYIFVLFGIGALLPWNAVLTGLDFFIQNFEHHNPAFTFGLTLNAPNFAFNFVGIFLARYISLGLRLIVGLIFILVITIAMPIITNYLPESSGWILILSVIVIMGIANSFVQGGIFGFAGIFPFKYTGAVMLGNGLSGLSMNFFRMITLAIFPPQNDSSIKDNTAFIGSLIYFVIASLLVVCCIFGYLWVVKTEFATYYLKKSGTKTSDTESAVKAAIRGSGSIGNGNILLKPQDTKDNTDEEHTRIQESEDNEPSTFGQVYYQVSLMALQVLGCFLITFVVFPGTTLSTNFDFLGTPNNKERAWFSVLMITCFNVFDTVGRFAGGKFHLLTPNTVFILSSLRLIFIPLFVLVQLNSSPTWIFQSDWFRILNMALFSITNGYNSTLLMIYGPSLVKDADKERAGLIMSFHLVGGIFLGSLIASFAMDKIG